MRRLLSLQKKVCRVSNLSKKMNSGVSEMKRFQEQFLNGTNSVYMEQLYEMWRVDRKSVMAEWDVYFENVEEGLGGDDCLDQVGAEVHSTPKDRVQQQINWQLRVQLLIKSYQTLGHQLAQLDPLCLDKALLDNGSIQPQLVQKLDYKYFGLEEKDLGREVVVEGRPRQTLGQLINYLQHTYCRQIGFEFIHLNSREEREWLTDRIEQEEYWTVDQTHQQKILSRLGECYSLTEYLKQKFSTSKRFGVEGCDTTISGLGYLIHQAHQQGIDNIIMGMPHRGRLETLALIFKKDISEIMCEFQESKQEEELEWGNSGDVKYHLGTTHDMKYEDGSQMRLSLLANPSHLEAVDPVVAGKVRATQDQQPDSKVLGIMVHGDAAFAGQGMVFETLQMQDLKGYKTEGTVHIVINNQIGFTTTPREARTGLYCTEVAKAIAAPIFHVNADYPEKVDKCIQLAMEFRQTFQRDVVIDIIGYRKHGHNELDQPMFTQPFMYQAIHQMQPVFLKYAHQLIQQQVVTQSHVDQMLADQKQMLEKEYLQSKNNEFDKAQWEVLPWEQVQEVASDACTGVSAQRFHQLGEVIGALPTDHSFRVHPQILKVYEQRQQMFTKGQGVDWAAAEALAFASLIEQGYKVRLSGEDVERGTFSHRHGVIIDQEKAQKHTPLEQVRTPECITISNSHLSEQGVLGFEYGYSLSNPNHLVLWEAQFGDFFNGAQVIFDNFISSAETKWNQSSSVTLLLPHGLDGLGPEHSSARMMRFLQMSNDDYTQPITQLHKQQLQANFQLANPTTAANYFHLLRRQMIRNFRKPLVVFSPKKLLRLKQACSSQEDFDEQTCFQEVIDDQGVNRQHVQQILFCQGQVYYDLISGREQLAQEHQGKVSIVRLEELAPFPYLQLEQVLRGYNRNVKVGFVQEEHQNDGPWWYLLPRITTILNTLHFTHSLLYIGRMPSGPTATGSNKVHALELQDIIHRALHS